MTKPKKILRIDLIESPIAGTMEFANGERHDVLQPTVRQQQVIIALENEPTADNLLEMHKVVRALVPTLTDEQFGALSNEQMRAIITLASANIEAVEALFPLAVSPETPQTSPG